MTLACCVLAGCGPAEETPEAAGAARQDSVGGVAVYAPSEERVDLPTSRIYYTLTSHDWYARGEPLVHDGRGYRAQGMPITASLTEMDKAGEFEGVEYYVRSGDPAAAVYVPVFSGYWQAFQLDPSAPVKAAMPEAAAAAPADSLPADSTSVRD